MFLPVRLTITKQTFNHLNKLQANLLRKNANFYFLQLHLSGQEVKRRDVFMLKKIIYGLGIIFISFILIVIFSIVGHIKASDFVEAFFSPEVRFALSLSFKSAIIATGFSLLIGIPVSYGLARYRFRGKVLIDTLVDLPIVLPPLLSGLGLLIFFSQTGVGRFINDKVVSIIFSPNGIVIAQFFIATPFVIRTAKAVFETIDERYEYVAQSLGSTPWESFWRIVLPMAKKGLIASGVLAWARCIGEFGATLILAGATKMRTETLPIAIFLNISLGKIELALAIATLILILSLGTLVSVKILGNLQDF